MSFETDNQMTVSGDDLLLHFFEEQVRCHPDEVAIVFENSEVTYAQLNARANQVARYLRRLGVGPEVLVALCLTRSIKVVVAIMGILKAGGAYVPLDPAYPQQRLRFMLEDAEAPLLITERPLLSSLSSSAAHTICLDYDWNAISRESDENVKSSAVAENLAYVIYTSGSTGKPKGVAITRRSVTALIDWARPVFYAAEMQGALASTSICFDLSVFELIVTLALGGCVVLVENAVQLARLELRRPITLINTVPSVITELLRLRVIPQTVTTINLAGEPLKTSLVNELYDLPHVERVFDLYGPSEDTTYSTVALRLPGAPATIGRPISNTAVFILDSNLNPVPDGAPGEIYLGGLGLARGYLRRPDLTAERFVPHPFSSEGSRLYRTGDIGRYLEDGKIEYLGRVDSQIKLRGFRIELGEIEARLYKYPSVTDCAVAVKEAARGEKMLTAYLVADEQLHLPGLRAFLREALPEYMIPSAFVRLSSLPLTLNGKIDRNALPEPPTDSTGFQQDYRAPQGDVEVQLTEIFAEVLGLTSVGTQSDFFEVGGHSLLAVRLFAEIERQFDIRLPLATLFEAGTISQLAKVICRGSSSAWSSLVPIQPGGSRPPLFCLHGCGAHVFIYRPLVRRLSVDQPVYGLQARGIEGKHKPFTRVEEMAAHYKKEIRGFQPHGPYYLLGDTLGGLIALELAQQLEAEGEDVALLAMLDTFCPLPLPFGPRMVSHFYHFKEQGLKQYLHYGAESVVRKLAKRSSESTVHVALNEQERNYAASNVDQNDPVQRTEWAIYLATQVNYRLPDRYSGKITYFLARDNEYAARYEDNRLLWKKLAKEFEVHVIPGRHDSIREEPHVAIVADKLTTCIARATAERVAKALVKREPDQTREPLKARAKGATGGR